MANTGRLRRLLPRYLAVLLVFSLAAQSEQRLPDRGNVEAAAKAKAGNHADSSQGTTHQSGRKQGRMTSSLPSDISTHHGETHEY